MATPEVRDVPERSRYEADLDGSRAGIAAYTRDGDLLVLTHTIVEPEYEGRGVGSALIRAAVDDARARGLQIVPRCPFAADWLRRHPDQLDVVAPGHRPDPA